MKAGLHATLSRLFKLSRLFVETSPSSYSPFPWFAASLLEQSTTGLLIRGDQLVCIADRFASDMVKDRRIGEFDNPEHRVILSLIAPMTIDLPLISLGHTDRFTQWRFFCWPP